MNKDAFVVINGITWYCLSVFYARKDFHKIIFAAKSFYHDNKDTLTHFSMYSSTMQGERLDIVISSKQEYKEKIFTKMDDFFQNFVNTIPSNSNYSFPNGNVLWCDYKNNNVVWNKFHIPHFFIFNEDCTDFFHNASILIFEFYDESMSYADNITTLNAFFTTKLYLSSLSDDSQKLFINQLKSFDFEKSTVSENLEVISQYCLYVAEEELQSLFHAWYDDISKVYDSLGVEEGFNLLSSAVCLQLGCSLQLNVQVMSLISNWREIIMIS